VCAFQFAAPGGFSIRFADLLRTNRRLSGSSADVLVPIHAFDNRIMPQEASNVNVKNFRWQDSQPRFVRKK